MFNPPNPIKKSYYRCDRKFHLNDLIYLYEDCLEYAIVLISGKKTMFYLHSDNNTKLLKQITTTLPNSHKTGGQSAQRFERVRNEKIGWYIKKIVELMTIYYVSEGLFKYKSLIIAGPAQLKITITDNEVFKKYFSIHLSETLTIPEIDENTINQVITQCSNTLLSQNNDLQLINDFEQLINNPNKIDLLIFGSNNVIEHLNSGLLKDVYVYFESSYKQKIISLNSKTTIKIFKQSKFLSKYGEIIGVKYFSNINSNDDCNDLNDVSEYI